MTCEDWGRKVVARVAGGVESARTDLWCCDHIKSAIMALCGTCSYTCRVCFYCQSLPRSGHPRLQPRRKTLDSPFLYYSHQMAHQSPHRQCRCCPKLAFFRPGLPASSPPRPRYTRGPHAIRLRSHRRCTCACCFSAALSPPDSEYRPKRDRKTLFPLIPLSAHHHSALPISA